MFSYKINTPLIMIGAYIYLLNSNRVLINDVYKKFGKILEKSTTGILFIPLYIVGGHFMKTVKNLDPDSMFEELKESWRIETKMLMTTKPLSAKEIEFLKARAEEGSPLSQFNYGLYFLLFERDEKTAEEWWNKFFYCSNGYGLWKTSCIFAYLGDEYYEWSMKCLKRSA